jgi:hypothetical protein
MFIIIVIFIQAFLDSQRAGKREVTFELDGGMAVASSASPQPASSSSASPQPASSPKVKQQQQQQQQQQEQQAPKQQKGGK